ncbi:hypothetical protein EHS39_23695 [Ensifer sp. MPMI2T]|nr:hypothetical protein EHS39_23695 [Ensifer sp. MPMI2T]
MQQGVSLYIDPSGAQTGGRVIKREFKEIADAAVQAQRMTDALALAQQQIAKSAQASAQVLFAQQDALRAKFNPTYAVLSRYKQMQGEIREAHRLGAISVNEMSAAMSRERQAALSAVAAIKGHSAAFTANTAAIQANNAATRIAAMQRTNLIYQLNDIGVSLASGMNPLLVLIQQGSQIATIYGASEGGIGRAFKETATMAAGLVARIWPLVAALGGVYGAYNLISSFSADARNNVDVLTRNMAEQAMSANALKGAITDFASIRDNLVNASGISGALGSVISLQASYNAAIGESAGIQARASSSIVSDLRKEYDAKRSLLEIESRLQEANIATQRADLEAKRAQLRKEIGDQVFTRGDLEAQGFSDPRIGRFTQLPDSVTGIGKINSVIANSPTALEVARMSAELALSENQAKRLKDTLSQTFGGAAVTAGLERLSTAGTSLTVAAQGATSLATAVSNVATSVQTANSGVIDVTSSLQAARRLTLAGFEESSAQLKGMKTELADIKAILANAAKTPLSTAFGDGVTGSAATDAVSRAASSIQKVFQALDGGQTTARQAHESLELVRQSLYQIGGDPRIIDGFVNALINGQGRVRDLESSIKALSASLMNIPNRVISIGVQQYTVPSSGGGTTGVNVYGGNADFSYQQYNVGGKTIGVFGGNGYYNRQQGYIVDQADVRAMYENLGYSYGGARAAGGPTEAGKTYLVGENGPELLKMGGPGQVTNTNSTAAILSGGRDTLSLIEDHLYSVMQELRIHTNYWEKAENDNQEIIACLKQLKLAQSSYSSGSSSYSGGGYSSGGGNYRSGGGSQGLSHLDPMSPYYFNPSRNVAGRGGGKYDPVADALLNGNVSALNGVGPGYTNYLRQLEIGGTGGMPSLLDRLRRQLGFANNGQIMAGEDQKVEFFKRNKERVIIVDDNRVSDQRGGGSGRMADRSDRPVHVTVNQYGVDQRDARSRQAQNDEIRRTVQQALRS